MKEFVIWSDMDLNFEDWRADLEAEYPEYDEDELYQLMYDMNNEHLDDERLNLRKHADGEIVIIADLGRWNGRFSGYKELHSDLISDCLSTSCDYAKWYVDELGDLRCDTAHHDGRDYLLYRQWRTGLSRTQKENFLQKIYDDNVTRRDINRYTKRLGDIVANVYGFSIKGGK